VGVEPDAGPDAGDGPDARDGPDAGVRGSFGGASGRGGSPSSGPPNCAMSPIVHSPQMLAGAGLSTLADGARAGREATEMALAGLDGHPPALAVLFASSDHAGRAGDVLRAVHEVAEPTGLIGCASESVLAGRREVERAPAVAVWLAAMPDRAQTFRMEFQPTDSGGVLGGWTFDQGAPPGAPHLFIADPFSFPADSLLAHLNDLPSRPLMVGGMASGGRRGGETILFHDHDVLSGGAVGAELPDSVLVRTIVSQGCRPFGAPLVVTGARDNFLLELGGRPPLDRLQEALESLAAPDRELATEGLHVGRAIDEYKTEHGQGDFVVRGVLGVDPSNGAIAVGDRVAVGEMVRFHVRDAATADEELRSLLQLTAEELPARPAGALLFTCTGRGTRLFPEPDHDASLVSTYFGGASLAGGFCAGEFGPVGGRNFLHGFTASVAVFADRLRPSA